MRLCVPRTLRCLYQGQKATLHTRPLKACIVGSGPAGFYTAYKLTNSLPSTQIDIYERLPVPYGLARFGVAPDHPEVKNVTHTFDDTVATSSSSSSRIRFLGNVQVGVTVGLRDLWRAYDVIVFAYGASTNKELGIPGERIKGVVPARSFVGWYNGVPEEGSSSLSSGGMRSVLANAETATVVGHGNVALDIARILLSSVDSLRGTDITDEALEALSQARIKRVNIVGRRGPLQASFTIKEVRELINLQGTSFVNAQRKLYQDILSHEKLARPQKRLIELLAKQEGRHGEKSWDINYLLSPVSFNASDDGTLSSMTLTRNELVTQGDRVSARGTDEQVTMDTDLAFLSIGYQCEPIPGMSDIGVVFNTTRHLLPNKQGRVVSLDGVIPGIYCAGWAKNGPVGVIASTMRDAFETVDAICEDWLNGQNKRELDIDADDLVAEIKRKTQVIDWAGWKKIENYEQSAGRSSNPPRPSCKVVDLKHMLKIAKEGPDGVLS